MPANRETLRTMSSANLKRVLGPCHGGGIDVPYPLQLISDPIVSNTSRKDDDSNSRVEEL